MNTKTMEGLVGARTNMRLLNTPFRVYKEARLKGDTGKMEQAMGYMSACHEAACEYKEQADEGMKEDAEENRRIAEEQREEAIRKRREEREELEERIEDSRNAAAGTDTKETGAYLVEISEEGKVLLKDHADSDSTGPEEIKMDAVREPVTYTKTGEMVPAKLEACFSTEA